MAPLVLYHFPASPPSRAALLTIRNLKLDVDIRIVNLLAGDQLQEDFVKINPQHTIPTLDDNGFVVWESRAISQYLAEAKDKQLTLFSNIPKERALIQQRMYFDLGTLFPKIAAIFQPVWRGLSTVISQEAKNGLYEAFEWLDSYLEQNEWFVCEYVTIADLTILASVSTAVHLGADLSKFVNLSAWYERCKQLPGFAENDEGAKMLGDAIKEKLTEPF